MLNQVKALVTVSALVVVPGYKLDEVIGQCDSCLLVEDRCVGVGDEIGGYYVVVMVSEDTLHGALGGSFDGGADGLIGGSLVEAASEATAVVDIKPRRLCF